MRILCITGYYLPGNKAGGPIRTITNLVTHLGDEIDFLILTTDRDLGDTKPYTGIVSGQWQQVGKAQVRYLSRKEQGWSKWQQLLQQIDYDILYLNSFFSMPTIKTLLWRRLRLIPSQPIILAPRGEFSSGALEIKSAKKRAYINFALRTKLYDKLIWQATSTNEKQDILNVWQSIRINKKPQILLAPNLPSPNTKNIQLLFSTKKQVGTAKIIFISRVSRKKNLDYAIKLLQQITDDIVFDIYGPIEDVAYWHECQALIQRLPNNVQVFYKGSVASDDVLDTLSRYHIFLFPTRGENFGHIILEAFSTGCPILVSDQTPWRNLIAQNAGWDLPLDQPNVFREALKHIIDMDQKTWNMWSKGASQVAENFIRNPKIIDANRQLFYRAFEVQKKRF